MSYNVAASFVVGILVSGVWSHKVNAQDLPTDVQIQAAFGVAYNHLGLMEYCAAKRFASTADVANTRKVVDVTVAGMDVSPTARAQQAVGRHGSHSGVDQTLPSRLTRFSTASTLTGPAVYC